VGRDARERLVISAGSDDDRRSSVVRTYLMAS
jgi:hypothetical protein